MNIRPFSPAKSILLLSSAILFINVTSLLGQIEISNATNIADILAYLNSLGGILNPTNIGNQLIQGTGMYLHVTRFSNVTNTKSSPSVDTLPI